MRPMAFFQLLRLFDQQQITLSLGQLLLACTKRRLSQRQFFILCRGYLLGGLTRDARLLVLIAPVIQAFARLSDLIAVMLKPAPHCPDLLRYALIVFAHV